MECPYCLEDFNEEALVCKDCGRDLRLVLPVINENLRLLAQVVDLEDQVHKARLAVARATAPFAFWSAHCLVYILLPVILLIAAHFLIVVTLDISPLFLRLASIAIPLPFGFMVVWRLHHGIEWAIADGILIGLLAVTGMLIAVAVIDKVPVLPDNARDWRETLEYVASIALANITGGAGDVRAPHAAANIGCHGSAERCSDNDRANSRTSCRDAGVAPPRTENSG